MKIGPLGSEEPRYRWLGCGRVELGKPARTLGGARPRRWHQREGEAERTGRADCLGGAASDARAGRAAARDRSQAVKLSGEQLRDHRVPGGVELLRGIGTAPPSDAVGGARPTRP